MECRECGGSGELAGGQTYVPYGDTWVAIEDGFEVCDCAMEAQERARVLLDAVESLDEELVPAWAMDERNYFTLVDLAG